MIRPANLLLLTPTSRRTNFQYDLRCKLLLETLDIRKLIFNMIRRVNLLLEISDSRQTDFQYD